MRRRSKALIAIAGLLLLAGVAIKTQQGAVGQRLFEQAVADRVGRDLTADLPDGLHVGLCGTGSPLPSPTRAGPCTVVIAGKHIFVIDIGEGGARNLNLMGIPAARIEGLFLTHFHSDHTDGIGPLMLARWTSSAATTPLPVHGAVGVDALIAGYNAAYLTDSGYRTAHHGPKIVPPSGAGAAAVPFALPAIGEGDTVTALEQNGLRITAIRVDHGPVKPAVGYRFDYKGRSVVISGDTIKSASLIAGAKGAGLLVHEALQPQLVKTITAGLDAKGQKNLAQITRDILNYHTTPEEAAEVAKAAGVKELVLSHIVPPVPSSFFYSAFLGDARDRFDGKLVVGEDGMLFSLPAGSAEIIQRKLM